MYITINPGSEIPLFQQIHDQIVEAVAAGDLVEGQRLDPVRRVAADFGINPATVKKAYDLLQSEGIVTTARRSGSVIMVGRTPTRQQQRLAHEELRRTLARAVVQGISPEELQCYVSAQLDQLVAPQSAQDSNAKRTKQ